MERPRQEGRTDSNEIRRKIAEIWKGFEPESGETPTGEHMGEVENRIAESMTHLRTVPNYLISGITGAPEFHGRNEEEEKELKERRKLLKREYHYKTSNGIKKTPLGTILQIEWNRRKQ